MIARLLYEMTKINIIIKQDSEEKLEKLDSSYREVCENAGRKLVVVADRYPFRYLFDDYGIDYYAAFPGCSSETDAGYYIKGEFTANNYTKGDLTFDQGIVGMARLSSDESNKDYYNTASSQFFIMLEPKITMDGYYAAFGKVVMGMDAIEKISKMDTDKTDDSPRDEIYIVSARVDCHDYRPAEPKTIKKSSLHLN